MNELKPLLINAYLLDNKTIFLETEFGVHLVYKDQENTLESTDLDLMGYCDTHTVKVLGEEVLTLEEAVKDGVLFKLDSNFLKAFQEYKKSQRKNIKLVNQEMYITLGVGIVISIVLALIL